MSKKLEGNGRWESSRMMLPEHRSQSLDKGTPARTGPTREEQLLIREAILLPILLTMVDNSRRRIELHQDAIRRLYVTAAELLMRQIHDDLVTVKRDLKRRNIKLHEEDRIDHAIRYKYVCRGYEGDYAMTRDVARSEISIKLGAYIKAVFQK